MAKHAIVTDETGARWLVLPKDAAWGACSVLAAHGMDTSIVLARTTIETGELGPEPNEQQLKDLAEVYSIGGLSNASMRDSFTRACARRACWEVLRSQDPVSYHVEATWLATITADWGGKKKREEPT